MTSLKQIEANRVNALKSTGPRTEEGKQRSRQNALRHGLTAETVVTALENAGDYQAFEANVASDYQPRSTTERELVSRLASLLWRLRRSTSIETGLFQIEGELIQARDGWPRRRRIPAPEWCDEPAPRATVGGSSIHSPDLDKPSHELSDTSESLANCYLQVSRLRCGAFEVLSRYETGLWRQASQLLFMLQSVARR